jgi:hypothetical protein
MHHISQDLRWVRAQQRRVARAIKVVEDKGVLLSMAGPETATELW